MRNKLSVAFVWHMHQPFYKDLVTGEYMLPWVRLHAIKDYFDMAAYLDDFPQIRSTYNVVPSLLAQIEDYTAGNARDKYLELSIRQPQDLNPDEKVFILKNFFMANWDTMVKPYPRYADLLLKRGRFVTIEEIAEVSKRFSNREFFDLQIWFNLAWFGQ
ncbi:MAG: glycoside hydrolase, partial [Candidatus Margulisiibacteriota bacterium]